MIVKIYIGSHYIYAAWQNWKIKMEFIVSNSLYYYSELLLPILYVLHSGEKFLIKEWCLPFLNHTCRSPVAILVITMVNFGRFCVEAVARITAYFTIQSVSPRWTAQVSIHWGWGVGTCMFYTMIRKSSITFKRQGLKLHHWQSYHNVTLIKKSTNMINQYKTNIL